MTDRQSALAALLNELTAAGYAFVTPTPATHARVNARAGNETARNVRDALGWSRPFEPAAVGQRIFALLQAADAIERDGALYRSRLRVSSLDTRLYLHSAYPTDAADSVFFGPDTYRFVRAALARLPDRAYERAVDLGCGSGAGGLEISRGRRVEALIFSDINQAALELAVVNAGGQERPAEFRHGDLLADIPGAFDLVVANPPYLADPERRAYRNGGGALGLDLGLRILREVPDRLRKGGVLFLYTGVPILDGADPLHEYAASLFGGTEFSLSYSEIDPDVFGEELERPAYRSVDRLAAVSLMLTRN